MAWSRAHYDDLRQEIRPGDLIAIGGKGGFAGVIKWATELLDRRINPVRAFFGIKTRRREVP
jgi:NAD(P)H-flavin reductase